MPALAQRLFEFFRAPGPDGMVRLRRSWHMPLPNTNFDFMSRLVIEGMEIARQELDLGYADSLVHHAPFSLEDVCRVMGHVRDAEKALADNAFSEEALAAMQRLPSDFDLLAGHYREKVTRSKTLLEETEAAIEADYEKLDQCLRLKDREGLLALFPHAARQIHEDGESDVPAHDPALPSLKRARMGKDLVAEITRAKQQEKQPMGISLFGWLGKPETIRQNEQSLSALHNDITRNGAVLAGAETFLAGLKAALDEPAMRPNAETKMRPALVVVSSRS